jgi:hypothetical protein
MAQINDGFQTPRTSISHPIKISWIVKDDGKTTPRRNGELPNFALSSCPGKKVRIDTGPVKGKGCSNSYSNGMS